MKNKNFIIVSIIFILSACSQQKIDEKNNEFLTQIARLHCNDSVQIPEINYPHIVRNIRRKDNLISIRQTTYSINKQSDNLYLLSNDSSNYKICLDIIPKISHGGISKTPMMTVKRLCN